MRNNISEPLDRACAGRVLPKRNVSSHFIDAMNTLGDQSSLAIDISHLLHHLTNCPQ